MLCKKRIFLIVACDLQNIIGNDGKVPWQGQMPSDMRRFRKLTEGNSVIMGRKTWDSLPPRFKPLPNRQNIVLTNNPQFSLDEKSALIAYSLEEAVAIAHSSIVWIIGGEEVYRLALPFSVEIRLTIIHERFAGNASFPQLDYHEWNISERESSKAGENGDSYDSDHFRLVRKI